VPVRKLESTDAFLVTDLADAPLAVGVVRAAPKVLLDGAELLARAATYAFATFEVRAGGASAGVNAKPEAKDDAVRSFVDELAPVVASGALHLSPGTGVTEGDLAAWGIEPLDESLAARGAVAAAAAFLGGGAGGRTAAVQGPPGWLDRVSPWWADVGGGDIVDDDAGGGAEVLFVAGKAGLLDHEGAASVTAKLLVPLTPVPVTAKAYAALSRAGTVLLPDAVSCAAPLLAVADPEGGDAIERVAAAAGALAGEGVDAWRSMVDRAESFLSTWQPSLPFGRPLA
jgi:glutamate dehydrogenase/leucine dehydrogenase